MVLVSFACLQSSKRPFLLVPPNNFLLVTIRVSCSIQSEFPESQGQSRFLPWFEKIRSDCPYRIFTITVNPLVNRRVVPIAGATCMITRRMCLNRKNWFERGNRFLLVDTAWITSESWTQRIDFYLRTPKNEEFMIKSWVTMSTSAWSSGSVCRRIAHGA